MAITSISGRLKSVPAKIIRMTDRAAATVISKVHTGLSPVYGYSLRQLVNQERPPKWIVANPKKVASITQRHLSPQLQDIIFKITGRRPGETDIKSIEKTISRGIETGIFDCYGLKIFINANRLDHLLKHLGKLSVFQEANLDLGSLNKAQYKKLKRSFEAIATRKRILRKYTYGEYLYSGPAADEKQPNAPHINTRIRIKARDGAELEITRIINQSLVKTDDNQPSIAFAPGLACGGSIGEKLAFRLADANLNGKFGSWVHLLDFRNMGANKALAPFDINCSMDTMISDDFPAMVDVLYKRARKPKPLTVIGHSLGGVVSENAVIRQSYKLDQCLREISLELGQSNFVLAGKTRREIALHIKELQKKITAAALNEETKEKMESLLGRAEVHLGILNSVKGLITVASPKRFDKKDNVVLASLLFLEYFLPLLKFSKVPVGVAKKLVAVFPFLSAVAWPLIEKKNFNNSTEFLAELITKHADSFSLPLGLQLEKAIYGGRGLKRLDEDFRYIDYLHLVPIDLPIFHIVFRHDPLCKPEINLSCVRPDYFEKEDPPVSAYQHKIKMIFELGPDDNVTDIEINPEKSQATAVIIDGARHLDCFEGKEAERTVLPLIEKIVRAIELAP